MIKHTVISLDLAKNIIQIAKISKHGEVIFNKAQSPSQIKSIIANTSPCIVAMEGCGSCHYWGRYAQAHGHEVRIIQPKHVKAFTLRQKTDANDAIGIAIAACQPLMPVSPVKSLEQQQIQNINTSRKQLDKSCTAQSNHIRALMYEYGVTTPKGLKGLRERVVNLLSAESVELPAEIKALLSSQWQHYLQTIEQRKAIEKQLESLTMSIESCQRLQALEGVGSKSAALLYATLGSGEAFKSGREASVYVGATPKQFSSGGKTVMVGISKQGDRSLRSTLYQGAVAVISRLPEKATNQKQDWLINLVRRVGFKRACIALVNKTVRTAWAMLRYNTEYQKVALVN